MKHHFRFKDIDELRVHCKDHSELKCEICSDEFCKQSDLVAHQEQGCEAFIESPELVETKPTFIDCSLETDANLEQPFDCGITPKEINSDNNGDSLDGIDRNGDEDIDDSNHAEISAECEPGPSHAQIANKRRNKSSQKRIRNRRKPNGNENDAADRIYHCYLCEKK